jgi:carboxylesterase
MNTNNQLFLEGYNGEAILLLHGISSGCAQMIPLGRMLNDYGYAVHCVNVAGHGTYPEDLLHTSWEDMITKADYDFSMLKRYYDKVYVSGLSLGGDLCLELASQRTDLAGIIAVSAPLRMLPGNFVTETYPEDKVFIHRDLGGKELIAKKYHVHYEEIAVRVCRELLNMCEDLRREGVLEKITCPALIAQAQDDNMADPQSCHQIMARIASANKVLYNPATGGHNLTFNEGRFDLMKAIVAFLKP